MDKIIDLRQKRAKAWEDAKAFLNTHADENGLLNAEDESTYDKMEADITKFGAQIDRLERQKALDLELSMPVSKPITEKPASAKKDEKTGFASDEYKKSFWDFMRTSPASITPALKKAKENILEMLTQESIVITEIEMDMLIESVVAEFNLLELKIKE